MEYRQFTYKLKKRQNIITVSNPNMVHKYEFRVNHKFRLVFLNTLKHTSQRPRRIYLHFS